MAYITKRTGEVVDVGESMSEFQTRMTLKRISESGLTNKEKSQLGKETSEKIIEQAKEISSRPIEEQKQIISSGNISYNNPISTQPKQVETYVRLQQQPQQTPIETKPKLDTSLLTSVLLKPKNIEMNNSNLIVPESKRTSTQETTTEYPKTKLNLPTQKKEEIKFTPEGKVSAYDKYSIIEKNKPLQTYFSVLKSVPTTFTSSIILPYKEGLKLSPTEEYKSEFTSGTKTLAFTVGAITTIAGLGETKVLGKTGELIGKELYAFPRLTTTYESISKPSFAYPLFGATALVESKNIYESKEPSKQALLGLRDLNMFFELTGGVSKGLYESQKSSTYVLKNAFAEIKTEYKVIEPNFKDTTQILGRDVNVELKDTNLESLPKKYEYTTNVILKDGKIEELYRGEPTGRTYKIVGGNERPTLIKGEEEELASVISDQNYFIKSLVSGESRESMLISKPIIRENILNEDILIRLSNTNNNLRSPLKEIIPFKEYEIPLIKERYRPIIETKSSTELKGISSSIVKDIGDLGINKLDFAYGIGRSSTKFIQSKDIFYKTGEEKIVKSQAVGKSSYTYLKTPQGDLSVTGNFLIRSKRARANVRFEEKIFEAPKQEYNLNKDLNENLLVSKDYFVVPETKSSLYKEVLKSKLLEIKDLKVDTEKISIHSLKSESKNIELVNKQISEISNVNEKSQELIKISKFKKIQDINLTQDKELKSEVKLSQFNISNISYDRTTSYSLSQMEEQENKIDLGIKSAQENIQKQDSLSRQVLISKSNFYNYRVDLPKQIIKPILLLPLLDDNKKKIGSFSVEVGRKGKTKVYELKSGLSFAQAEEYLYKKLKGTIAASGRIISGEGKTVDVNIGSQFVASKSERGRVVQLPRYRLSSVGERQQIKSFKI